MGAAIAGGVLLVIAAMGSCYVPRDYPDPVPDAGNDSGPLIDGSQVDGMQACLDWCTLSKQLCAGPPADTDCVDYCELQFGNATLDCKNELSALFACYLQGVQSPGDGGDPCALSCGVYQLAVASCISKNGCVAGNYCYRYGPNDEGCACRQMCRNTWHDSACHPTGTMTSVCECTVGPTLLGTCDGGVEPFCDPNLWKGCCNEYFKL